MLVPWRETLAAIGNINRTVRSVLVDAIHLAPIGWPP